MTPTARRSELNLDRLADGVEKPETKQYGEETR
jgi:hypothetical protein